MATDLLFDLEIVHNRCKLSKNLVCLLMKLELCCNKIRKVAEGFWGVNNLEEVRD